MRSDFPNLSAFVKNKNHAVNKKSAEQLLLRKIHGIGKKNKKKSGNILEAVPF
jgi:hypothetical protein